MHKIELQEFYSKDVQELKLWEINIRKSKYNAKSDTNKNDDT